MQKSHISYILKSVEIEKKNGSKNLKNTWQKHIFWSSWNLFLQMFVVPTDPTSLSSHLCVFHDLGHWIISHTVKFRIFLGLKGPQLPHSLLSLPPPPMQSVAMVTSASLFFSPHHFEDILVTYISAPTSSLLVSYCSFTSLCWSDMQRSPPPSLSEDRTICICSSLQSVLPSGS